jgi:hypothetical protein
MLKGLCIALGAQCPWTIALGLDVFASSPCPLLSSPCQPLSTYPFIFRSRAQGLVRAVRNARAEYGVEEKRKIAASFVVEDKQLRDELQGELQVGARGQGESTGVTPRELSCDEICFHAFSSEMSTLISHGRHDPPFTPSTLQSISLLAKLDPSQISIVATAPAASSGSISLVVQDGLQVGLNPEP